MFAAKSLTMEERGAKKRRRPRLALVAMGRRTDQICQLADSVATEGFILFKFVWAGGAIAQAMAWGLLRPSAGTLFV